MMHEGGNPAYLEAIGRDLEVAARRYARVRRRRRAQMRIAALAVTAVILVSGSALAGSTLLLGMQAPRFVQGTIDSVWPSDDTSDLAPVKGGARLVARSGSLGLYRSQARSGGGDVCLSIVPGNGGQACVKRMPTNVLPFGLLSTVVDGRQVVYGQLRGHAGAKLTVQWNGGAVEIPIGADGFFLGDLPLARAQPGAEPEMATLRVVGGDGVVIVRRDLSRLAS